MLNYFELGKILLQAYESISAMYSHSFWTKCHSIDHRCTKLSIDCCSHVL